MDDIQANAIFKLSTPSIKKSVRQFLKDNKGLPHSELTNAFSELYTTLASSLHQIDKEYKLRTGHKVSRITYKQVVALAWGAAPKCKGCGEPSIKCLPGHPGHGAFRTEYCSHHCLNHSDHAWAKRKATTAALYGSDNYFGSKDFSEKLPDRLENKFGIRATNISQIPKVQAKKVATSLRKRGVPHHMQDAQWRKQQANQGNFNSEFYSGMRDNAMTSYESKTGYDNPRKNPEVQDKIARTNVDKYGTANPAKSEPVRRKIARSNASQEVQEQYRKTSMQNNGTPYPNHSPSVARKVVGKRFTLVECLGRTLKLEGCEPVVAKHLESIGTIRSVVVPLSKIPYTKDTGQHSTYNPDLAAVGVSGQRYLIECKDTRGLWAEGFMGSTNLAKLKALEAYCTERGYTPLLIIVHKQNSIEFRKVEVIRNPVAWMEEATRQKLKRALSLNPALAPTLRLSRKGAQV